MTMTVSAPSVVRCAAKAERLSGLGAVAETLVSPKVGLVAVVVAVHLDRLVGRRARCRRRPARRHVQPFAAEDAEDVGLGGGAVDVALRAPVVLGDADLRAGVVRCSPSPSCAGSAGPCR